LPPVPNEGGHESGGLADENTQAYQFRVISTGHIDVLIGPQKEYTSGARTSPKTADLRKTRRSCKLEQVRAAQPSDSIIPVSVAELKERTCRDRYCLSTRPKVAGADGQNLGHTKVRLCAPACRRQLRLEKIMWCNWL